MSTRTRTDSERSSTPTDRTPSADASERGWRDLDNAPDRDRLLRFLDAFAALPEVAAAKVRSFALLAPRPGQRLLDGGCGTGADGIVLARLVSPNGEVVGIDGSAGAVEVAAQRAAHRDGVRFEVGDLEELKFPDGHFDGARADRVLLHVPRPERAVAELARVTRPGGRVVVTEATYSERGAPAASTGQRLDGRRVLMFLPYLLARAGIEHVRVERFDSTVQPGPDVRAGLETGEGPLDLTIVHFAGVVGGGTPG